MEGSDEDEDEVILVCTNPHNPIESTDTINQHILLSTTHILASDLTPFLTSHTIKVHAHRNRLIEQSLYFRGLLGGSFSESCLGSVNIDWNLPVFMQILKHMCGCPLDITTENVLPLYEGALYFGVETLLLKCETWFSEVFSPEGFQLTQIQMDDLIQIWKFGLDHASDLILHLCISYLARNFMWAKKNNVFGKIPYNLLLSSVKHPLLTVDSEMHLSDALLLWLESNMENLEKRSEAENNYNEILKQIRVGLLPLWFAAGKRNSFYFRQLAEESLDSIFRALNILPIGSVDISGYSDLQHLRIRLTEHSKKMDLSNCPQITSAILLLSLTPASYPTDPVRKEIIEQFFISSGHPIRDKYELPQKLLETFIFEAVQEVDISKCRRLFIEHAVDCLSQSFPSLRILKAAFLLNIRTTGFFQLLEKCSLVGEIDLTVDVTPLIPASVTVLSSNPAMIPPELEKTSSLKYQAVQTMPFHFHEPKPLISNVTKLTLEGRTDVSDLSLQYISKYFVLLCHLNIKGCISVTDIGISDLIRRCKKLNSIVVCDTSFGINSVQALCSATSDGGNFPCMHSSEKHLNSVVSNLQALHMGGCIGICELSLQELMSQTHVLKSLCLRGTYLVDQALYNFKGSSLEMLDVSNTKISEAALSYVIHGNPSLKSLKARGCKNLLKRDSSIEKRESRFSSLHEELHAELGKKCRLEEIEFGWGFSSFSLRALEPAVMSLKTINIGLGGMLGEDALRQLPAICPLLETIILHFQVISDIIVTKLTTSLMNLQVLALCYCFGDISMSSFKFPMQNLRKLRLERVTPWMTNEDLIILTQNCRNLVELSLLGCPLLNSDSQQIISHAWPGLVSIHLEDCGKVTANGVSALLDCRALEDLLLRHNGPGLQRNFIFHAASKMPLLRKLSLDICDASEGDFDIPNYEDRYFLSTLKIARCKSQRCAFNLPVPPPGSRRRSVHLETLVLVWNSKNLTRTVVKERL
ncbi:BTB/POZ domain-containing protein FBL11 isoform X1 [Cicer arietinum]|uniref:BTB/POZ domain-containing protein FBL11 n=1 Tax=Cicer arietinum TaxID=3827 RepID=A0A1S2XT98_CICAR|nr:BTB/POZ domain-containing protein FBL11 [Cicer arietinum]